MFNSPSSPANIYSDSCDLFQHSCLYCYYLSCNTSMVQCQWENTGAIFNYRIGEQNKRGAFTLFLFHNTANSSPFIQDKDLKLKRYLSMMHGYEHSNNIFYIFTNITYPKNTKQTMYGQSICLYSIILLIMRKWQVKGRDLYFLAENSDAQLLQFLLLLL